MNSWNLKIKQHGKEAEKYIQLMKTKIQTFLEF